MIRAALLVAIALAAQPRRADACSCAPQVPFVSGSIEALPPGASLYVFVPAGREDQIDPALGHEIHRSEAGSVRRVRGPGAGSFALLDATWEVAPSLPPAPPLRLRSASYRHELLPMCGPEVGFHLRLDGGRASAYRLRWTRDGQRREAYLPAIPGEVGGHFVRLGETGCEPAWLSPRTDGPFDDVELSMLTFDGEEIVVARGALELEEHAAALPTFVPPPPPVVRPTPGQLTTPPPRVVWWRVVSGALGGLVLGALASWLVSGRRRAAT